MTSSNIMTLKAASDSVMISSLNLGSNILNNNRHLLRNVKYWHKFIVSNTDGLSRDEVLKTILDHVHPLDLIPVFYAKDPMNSNSYFLARNCESAIEKLYKDNLTLSHPYAEKQKNVSPFKLNIVLNFANTTDVKIDVQKNVLQVLNKRFSSATKTLDLDRFCKDPDLIEFCPLSQPKIMYFVLHIAKNLTPEELILSNNDIKLLNPLDVLIGLKLRAMDLSNNELTALNDLSGLKHFHLKELKISGNPFCDCEEDVYVSKVRLLCPTVEILDGITLNIDRFPTPKRYFFCVDTGYDLVNQFLEYFYSVYDTQDRKSLAGLYHSQALFSLTCVYRANQLSSGSAFLKMYSEMSRNLKRSADFSRTDEHLFKGRNMIMNVFEYKLPLTEHDPYSFTVDLMYKSERFAVIVVNGIFHEIPKSLLDKERSLGFSRTFALELIDSDSKYMIVNEQLHVYNALTCQEQNAFLEPITHNKLIQRDFLPKPQNKLEFAHLIYTLGQITNLKQEWAKKCLEECEYDLRKSLELFVELYKADKMPQYAFLEISKENTDPFKSNPEFLKTNPVNNDHNLDFTNSMNNNGPLLINNTIRNNDISNEDDFPIIQDNLSTNEKCFSQKQVYTLKPKKSRPPSTFTVLR